MIIYKHEAECTEDKSIFYGKIEIETNNELEWESLKKIISSIGEVEDVDTVCHCNVKENAEIIAQILDFDVKGEIAPVSWMPLPEPPKGE